MTIDEINESTSILATMMTALSGTLSAATGTAAADLYYAIGDLQANAGTLIRSGVWGAQLLACFDLSVAAGATIANMELVRLAMVAEDPQSVTAIALTNAGIRLCLIEEVKILAATSFASRTAIEAALSALIAAFEGAVEYAADSGDSAVFQALIAAQAAAVSDLNTRAQSLPSIVTYSFGRPMTSHALSQRLYGTAANCDQLVAMNGVIDPQFCPPTGEALSSSS